MSAIERRIVTLESLLPPMQSPNGHTTLAEAFRNKISRIAERYPDEAAHTPAAERERYFSPAERLAWTIRFARTEDELRAGIDEARAYAERSCQLTEPAHG